MSSNSSFNFCPSTNPQEAFDFAVPQHPNQPHAQVTMAPQSSQPAAPSAPSIFSAQSMEALYDRVTSLEQGMRVIAGEKLALTTRVNELERANAQLEKDLEEAKAWNEQFRTGLSAARPGPSVGPTPATPGPADAPMSEEPAGLTKSQAKNKKKKERQAAKKVLETSPAPPLSPGFGVALPPADAIADAFSSPSRHDDAPPAPPASLPPIIHSRDVQTQTEGAPVPEPLRGVQTFRRIRAFGVQTEDTPVPDICDSGVQTEDVPAPSTRSHGMQTLPSLRAISFRHMFLFALVLLYTVLLFGQKVHRMADQAEAQRDLWLAANESAGRMAFWRAKGVGLDVGMKMGLEMGKRMLG